MIQLIIINNPGEISITESSIDIRRNVCNGVECCPYSEDSGWDSNPSSDMTS